MKKIYIVLILLIPNFAFAITYNTNGVGLNIYGTIYGDLFYTNGTPSLLNNFYGTGNSINTITSNASKGSSKIGIHIRYDKLEAVVEAGISDPIRKFYLKYNFNKNNHHYILIGRDTNIAHYYFGQMSNDGQALNDYGSIISRRRLQVRYGFKGLEIAIILPYIGFSNADDMAYSSKDKNSDYIFNQIPRFEATYNYKNNYLHIKPFISYGTYLYKVSNTSYAVNEYTIGIGGRVNIDNLFIDFMAYFGQNMYLNSSYGGYSGFASSVNPVEIFDNKINIHNYYSAGGGLGFGYLYADKILFQMGVGYNSNFNEEFYHIHSSIGSYINTRYYITKMLSILFEVAYLNNMYDIKNNNNGNAIITGGIVILQF